MTKRLRSPALLALATAMALAAPAFSTAKRPAPAPPPDSADDCTFVAEAVVPEYLVIASLDVGVRCDTVKRSISVSAQLTRDGVVLFVLPLGSGERTCTNAATCFIGYDLFSLDTQPVPTPGDQLYCASGTGAVGGRTLGPASACESDARL